MLRFIGKTPVKDSLGAGVFADHKTKVLLFEFDRFIEGTQIDLSTFDCKLHIAKLGFVPLPVKVTEPNKIQARMVVTNGLTNYPGVHKCSFKFTSGEYSWGTENFFLRVFDGQDSNQELTDDPP